MQEGQHYPYKVGLAGDIGQTPVSNSSARVDTYDFKQWARIKRGVYVGRKSSESSCKQV